MATLDEPYLVTSYGINPDQVRAGKTVEERFKLAVTSVNYLESKASKAGKQQSRRAIAVNTVQGNGIHLVDLSDQSPLSAFTVSPTTIFTCKAVSVSSETSASSSQALIAATAASTSAAGSSSNRRIRSRKTFVGLQQNGDYQLCCWTEVEDVDGTAVGDAVKVTKTVDHPIISVTYLENGILATDSNGTLTVFNQDLSDIMTHSLKRDDSSKILSRLDYLAYSPLLDSEGALVGDKNSLFRLAVLCFERTPTEPQSSPKKKKSSKKNQAQTADDPSQGLQTSQDQVRVVYLTIGRSQMKIVEAGSALLPVEGVIDCVQLQASKFATLDSTGRVKVFQLDRSALEYVRPRDPLTLSPVTLPLLTTNERGFKLKSDVFALRHARLSPVSLTQTTTTPSSCLVLAAPRTDRPGAVEIILWDTTLGLALASRETTLPTLLEREGLDSLAVLPLPSGLVGLAYTPTSDTAGLDTQAQLAKRLTLHAMACTAPAQLNLASVVGKRALTQQYVDDDAEEGTSVPSTIKAGTRAESTTEEAIVKELEKYLTQDTANRNVEAADKAYNAWMSSTGNKDWKSSASPHRLAKRLLRLAVPTQKNLSVSSAIVLDLLQNRRVSDSDVEGGLTARLLERQDWDLVVKALDALDDVSEDTQVSTLAAYLNLEPSARSSTHITLPELLRQVVKAPASPSTLRSSLKKRLNADNLKAVLQTLDRWLALELEQTALDGPVKSDSPGTFYITPFLQALLDAHLVTILQTSDLHPLVQSVSSHLLRAISFSVSLQGLQGPLDAISKEHAKEKAREAALKAEVSKKGQYEVKAWNAKKALQENQLLLGDYAVETFQL